MAMICKRTGLVIPDARIGAVLRAIFDDATLEYDTRTGAVRGVWCDASQDGTDWLCSDMSPAECRAYVVRKGIRGWAD